MKKFVLGALCLSALFCFALFQLNIEEDDIVHEAKQFNQFMWLQNLNILEKFVRPANDTELFVPSNINATDDRALIACFVISSPHNVGERHAVRQTYGKLMKPLFVIGRADNETMRLVFSEALLFNDIIIEDFHDSYVNLTIKTAFAMKHFLRHFSGSSYFLKIDDDVYLNVDNLKRLLEGGLAKDAIIGRSVTYLKPHREKNSKLYVPYWLYEEEEFPPYHDGPAYLIPGRMIQSIFEEAMRIPFFTIEDAFFVGEVAGKRLNYTLLGNKHFRTMAAPYVSPCLHNRYITVHKTTPAAMIDLWEHRQMGYNCSTFEQLRSYMVYQRDMIV